MANVWLTAEECRHGDEDLPPVCIVCGADSTTTVAQKMSWYNPIMNLTILAGVLIWVIIVLIVTKRMTVNAPVCDGHRGHWFKHKLYSTLAALAGFVALFVFMFGGFLIAENDRNLGWVGLAGVLVGAVVFFALIIVAVVVSKRMVRPMEITEDDIRLTKVSDEFADELKAFRKKNRGRRRDDDEEEEDDDPPPRRRSRRFEDDDE